MEQRKLGKTDMQVNVLGYGGAEIGLEATAESNENVSTLLNSSIDEGLNVIDTAECYGNSEELIGKAVSHRRKEFYLFSKCGHPLGRQSSSEGMPEEDWRPKSLLESIQRSLIRLKTDYLDLVQLHSCKNEILLQGEVIETLQRAVDKGYTRYIGYSGDNQEAIFAATCGGFDCLQTSISIADQSGIDTALSLAKENNLGVIAKRPIANVAWRFSTLPPLEYHHTYWRRLKVLKYPFMKDGLKHSVKTALRFTLSVPGVHTAIVGTLTNGRWRENSDSLQDGLMSEEEFNVIRNHWEEFSEPTWVGLT